MQSTRWTVSCSIMTLSGVFYAAVALSAQPPGDTKAAVTTDEKADATKKPDDVKRVSVEVARERAKLAHHIYSAVLDVIHDRYFHDSDERTTIPARAMEDVFSKLAWQENIKAKWIAVNAQAMSIDHRPQDKFEKQAARAIASGKREHELIESGVYRRAAGISLMNRGCLPCHLQSGTSGKISRFAGLVITIPVKKD